MAKNVRQYESQLCPIPTEAPWSIGANERSHGFIHSVIEKILAEPEYNPGDHQERLLSDVEMAWKLYTARKPYNS